MPFEREQWVTLWESVVKPTIVSNKVQNEGPLTRDTGVRPSEGLAKGPWGEIN